MRLLPKWNRLNCANKQDNPYRAEWVDSKTNCAQQPPT